jgi:hypothetical protein
MSIKREGADLARRVGVEAAAAGVGAVVGGPLGALTGAAIAPMIELVLLRERRALRNMEVLVEILTELSGLSTDEFASWAQEREGRLLLATSALQAACAAGSQYKLRGLARVLVDSLHDDARLDMANLIVAGLSELDPPHIRVLHTLVHQISPAASVEAPREDHGWSCVALKDQLPNLADGIMPIIAMLSRTGMITEASESTNDQLSWERTRFGITCLNYLGSLA